MYSNAHCIKVSQSLTEHIRKLSMQTDTELLILPRRGMAIRVVGKWKDKFNPSMKNLNKVADALGVSVATLLRESKGKE